MQNYLGFPLWKAKQHPQLTEPGWPEVFHFGTHFGNCNFFFLSLQHLHTYGVLCPIYSHQDSLVSAALEDCLCL